MASYDSDDASDAIDHPHSGCDLHESDSDEPDSSSETGDDAGGLLDIEASESDDDDSEESDEESLLDGTRAVSFWDGVDFPHFTRLPPEIREFVWRFFFESILERPRILEFQVTEADSYGWYPTPTNSLEAQMLPVLAAMRVNSESRAVALRSFPDKLLFGGELGGYAVPFDKETDIVAITFATLYPGCLHQFLHPDREQSLYNINFSIPGFTDKIKRLVISSDELAGTKRLAGASCTGPWAFLASFTNLEVIYEKHDILDAHKLDHSLSHAVQDLGITELDEAGLPHRYSRYLVWPDRAWREQQKGSMEIKLLEDLALDFEAMNGDMWELIGEKLRGVEVWPMVEFSGRTGRQNMVELGLVDSDHFPTSPAGWGDAESLEGEDDSDMNGDDDDDEEDDSEMDDFIDDGPVVDFEGTSDILDHDDVADAAFDGEDDGFGGFSPIDQGSDGDVGQGSGQEGLRPAKKRQARQIISDDEDHDEDEENSGVAKGQRSRQIISDDEDDDDDADARPAKKVKTQLVVVSSDSERDTSAADSESDEDAPRKKRGRPRVPDSESEGDGAAPVNSRKRKRGIPAVTLSDSEDEEAADAAPINPPKRKRAVPAVIVTDSEDESEDDTEDDKPGKVEITDSSSSEEDDDDETDGRAGRPLTLAEKLGMHRRANPIELSSEDEESSVDMPRAGRGYGHGYDDEDDEEDDEGKENGNDHYDGYPEESGSEDEDDAY
ncbi:hypothetical protein MAPG_08516 [Magnaporthiopsis poae ATCC 64411]|uniref:2EXR domain-containing protein n=1 Tax=Magnaporthiopsis poae (strain ATCC 64411 / 73-15) TaxID=644358 RepID=A0A0C4E7K3_MAGP6|nr:hypothetical protein MAPG_08516 [Magnaporthiopsis poae ATCC 64411]